MDLFYVSNGHDYRVFAETARASSFKQILLMKHIDGLDEIQ